MELFILYLNVTTDSQNFFSEDFLYLSKQTYTGLHRLPKSVILLPAHPASFVHNFVSGMQSFYFSESQDAIVLQICH